MKNADEYRDHAEKCRKAAQAAWAAHDYDQYRQLTAEAERNDRWARERDAGLDPHRHWKD